MVNENDLGKENFLVIRKLMQDSALEVIKRTLNRKDRKYKGSVQIYIEFDAFSPLEIDDVKHVIQKRLTDDLSTLTFRMGYGGRIDVTQARSRVPNMEVVRTNGDQNSFPSKMITSSPKDTQSARKISSNTRATVT